LTKSRIVTALLAAVTVWPLVQLALVARYDVSPWKLAGWGMYSTPRFDRVGMEVYGRRSDGAEEQLTAPSAAVATAATAFLESYRWLRVLAPRDAFADAILHDHPQWDEVRLVVFRPDLDAHTGMVVMLRAEYTHPRQ
jgi:hypothetical protein